MRHWILFVAVAVLAALARGQERVAEVLLVDGQRFSGRVVAMDLDHVEIAVGGKILTIAAKNIRSCHITSRSAAQAGGDPGSAAAATAPAVPPPAPGPGESAAGAAWAAAAEAPPPEAAVPEDPAPPRPVPVPSRAPAPSLVAAADLASGEAAETSLFDGRVEVIGSTLPWLRPSDPSGWFSIGLLLFAALTLIIHSSARLVGAEAVPLGRSAGLAVLYFAFAGAQVAWLPANDLTIFSALIGNSALVLYLVRKAYSLPRSSTFVAVAMQVGFGMLGLSLLQLVDSLMGSVAV